MSSLIPELDQSRVLQVFRRGGHQMTIGKASLLLAAFIAAVGLGVAIGPSMTHRDATVTSPAAEISQPAPVAADPPRAAAPRPPRAAAPRARTTKSAATAVPIPTSTPALHARLKPVLNSGANMTIAAEGFRDAEQFATVAHAARNTQVPFLLLKHRVLNEGQPLSDAIRASRPDMDAANEVKRARTQARSDLASISS